MTILVADDDPVICNLVAMNLEQDGFHVLTANDGREVLTRWQSRRDPIDLLITDLSMPKLDGLLLARCLALEDPTVPVLFMSGEAHPGELGAFQNWRFLAKPFRPSALVTEVNRLLRLDGTSANE